MFFEMESYNRYTYLIKPGAGVKARGGYICTSFTSFLFLYIWIRPFYYLPKYSCTSIFNDSVDWETGRKREAVVFVFLTIRYI